MPKRIQLPNGEWIYVPDMDSYFDQITLAPRNPEQQFFSDPEEEEEEKDEGTLAGSAWEGVKSIPSGVADIFLSGAQAAVGVVTPFADLPVEKRLRRQASKRARERDPAYRDAFLPAVGTGLGQVAGLSALSRLPGGWFAAMGAGVGMGISEQTRRIADYEQRTGTDVPWYKESSAHMMGALIGLSEVIPIKFGLFPAPIKNMMGRMKAGLSPSSGRHMSKLEETLGLRGAIGAGLMEATQEASAQWLQALSARGLYDPNAMEDIAHAMAEDFKVGGVVGGIARLVQHQILGPKFRDTNVNASLQAMIKEREYRQDQDVRDVYGNITGIAEDLPEILRELGTENRQLAQDITHMFGGEWAAIPFGMDALLKSGSISRFEVEGLVKEFSNRNEAAKAKLDDLIVNSRDDVQIEKYMRAKDAIDKMATDRIANLSTKVTELGGGLGEMGGLSGNQQYQLARQAAIEADADENMLGVFGDRQRGGKLSYLTAIRSLMGGTYGVGGFFKMAELLGTHGGPGSEKVDININDGSLTPPDLGLASSNRANFSIEQLGEILFGRRGEQHEKASEAFGQRVDQSDVLGNLKFADSYQPIVASTQQASARGTLRELNERLKRLQGEGDNLYKNYAFTREASEAQTKQKYAGDAAWIKARNEQQRILSVENQRINTEISGINRQRSIIHLRLLSQRLKEVKAHFTSARNLVDKKEAAKRVFGKDLSESEMGEFDTWLDQTTRVVEQSEKNGNAMADQADAARKEFDEQMARTDVSDADKEAFTAKFLSENARRFVEFPRDISAPQLTNIANLFLSDPKDPKLQATLALRALGDISNWQVQDKLYEVNALGLPDIDPTAKVVEEFIDKLNERVGIITDRSGKMSTKDGKPEDISVDDITNLLKSKNIYLRDGKRIGGPLARRMGAGVESRPFKKLLRDMTGASSWNNVIKDGKVSVKGATYAQRLLMYSRLLQLPAHYKSRGSPEEHLYLQTLGKENYRPLFLPDFYYDPSIDSHIDFMADNLIEVTEDGDQEYPSLAIRTLRKRTEDALGDTFDSNSFDEALARLIETGVFNRNPGFAPDAAPSETRVGFNVEYEPLSDEVTQPGDSRVQDEERWLKESDPELIRRLLANKDAAWKNQVDDMWAAWNERNPKDQLSREAYIKRYTALITSSVPLQELSDLGILDTVQGVVAAPDRLAPTESVLALDTAAGRGLVHSLMRSGALPSSMQDNVQSLRRRFTDTIRTRFEVLDKNVEELVKKLRLPDNIQRLYVDDVNGLFQFMGDVAIRGEEMRTEGGEVTAMYDRPGNRIIINLAAIDPNNMIDAQDIVKRAAFHEGIHALIIRDHLSEEELNVLYNFVRNDANIVPEEVDRQAHDAGLTWFQRSVAEFSDRRYQLNEADIEKEAVISLLESLVRFPAAMNAQVKGAKVRKIGKGLRGFLEGFVGAAKDADIIDVMKILSRIERGEVGDRGPGFLGDEKYTPDSIVRSNDLLRYADPEDIKKLRAAVILRDAAPSDRMRESEQAKVDDILDKIVANRGIIQESAPPIPDTMKAIENQRELIKHYRDTYPSSPPLLGLNQDEQNSDAYKIALDTFMEMRGRDPRYAYKMPAPYQTLFNQPTASNKAQELSDATDISTDKDPAREFLEKDPDKKTGDDVEATKENVKNTVGNLRYNYLDRRQWVVEQTDRLMAEQNRAQLDAETSALVMWRNSDNALNWLPSLMLRGPLSYLGTSVGAGRFENAPVYDNDLQENYGGDGRVQGLNDILALVMNPKDAKVALDYGTAKRVAWTRDRLSRLLSSTAGIEIKNLSPEVRREHKMFDEAYKDIIKGQDLKRLDELIEEVETNESNKKIIEFWDRYNAYDNHMIKMSYNTGMITREQRDEWLSMPYTPFYREMSEEDSFPVGSQQEIVKRGINKVEKALQGSMKPIKKDLMDNIITNTQALVRDAMMNVSASRTARDAVALGDAHRISISDMAASADPRVIRVMENGVPVFYQLKDPQLAMSVMLMGANPKKQLQKFFGEHKLGVGMQKLLTGSSQLLRETVTKTPPFAVKNVFRDSWQAMNLTGGGPKLVLEAFSNALDPDILRRAEETGLSIGIDFVADPGEYGNKMRSEFKKANLDWKDPLSPFIAAWNALGRIAKQSEVATRVAVYDRILAKTGDKALALHYAVEIMNYGRRGADPIFSTYMATIPFMNGRLQGLDVTYRGLRDKSGSSDIPGIYGYGLTADEYSDLPSWQKNRAQIAGRGLMLTFATGLLYLLMREDDEWQDLRDDVKADNWVLPLSDHAWLKIPIPFEIGVLFKVIPEKMFEAILEKDVGVADVGEETIRQLRTSLSIGGFPQLFAPVIGAMSNYDKFRKDGIVDHWMEETLSPNEQRNAYTSNVARSIADFANDIPLVNKLDFLTSPMKVEYMARQYLGTGGSYAITVADRLARTGMLPDIPYDPYMNLAEAESIIGTNKDFDFKSLIGGEGVANVPILGDLLTDPRTRGGRQQQFFEMIEELDTIVATLSSINDRDREKGFEYRQKHLNVLRHQKRLRYLQNRLKKWRERREYLAKIPSELMSNDEKREHYHRLLESRQGILAGIDTIMDSIKQG